MDLKSPEINKNRKTQNIVKKTNTQKIKLKEEEEQQKYTNFNLESWGNEQQEDENYIEEAFDLNHDNLMNFDESLPKKYVSDALKKRSSKEFKENPMYIEFELNNDDEDIVSPVDDIQSKNVFSY